MENASRALLIAGSVLVAIIVITLLVRTYGNIGNFQRQQLSVEEAQKLEEYNKQYTKYEHQYVYGTEVISIINKEENKNLDKVTIIINGREVKQSIELGDLSEVKNKAYYCNNVNINGETSKVDSIEFTEKNFQ